MFNELEQEVVLSTTETNVAQNASVISSMCAIIIYFCKNRSLSRVVSLNSRAEQG